MNYEKIYNDIISKARSEYRKKIKGGVYYEAHHIIPKCMGGTNDKSNLILLTAKEHYICHRLLCLIYPDNNKLKYAIWCMINGFSSPKKRYILSGRIYAQIKEDYSKIPVSKETRKRRSETQKGRIHSDEHKKKISESHKGKRHLDEAKKKISMANKGKQYCLGIIRSKETKKKLSDIAKLRPPMSDETKKKLSDIGKNRTSEEKLNIALKIKLSKLKNKIINEN